MYSEVIKPWIEFWKWSKIGWKICFFGKPEKFPSVKPRGRRRDDEPGKMEDAAWEIGHEVDSLWSTLKHEAMKENWIDHMWGMEITGWLWVQGRRCAIQHKMLAARELQCKIIELRMSCEIGEVLIAIYIDNWLHIIDCTLAEYEIKLWNQSQGSKLIRLLDLVGRIWRRNMWGMKEGNNWLPLNFGRINMADTTIYFPAPRLLDEIGWNF